MGAFVYLRLLRLYLPCHATLSCRNIPHPGTTPYTFIQYTYPVQLSTYHRQCRRRSSQYPKCYRQRLQSKSHYKRHALHWSAPTLLATALHTYRRTYQHIPRHLLYPLLPNKILLPSQPTHNANLPAHAQFGPRGTLACTVPSTCHHLFTAIAGSTASE